MMPVGQSSSATGRLRGVTPPIRERLVILSRHYFLQASPAITPTEGPFVNSSDSFVQACHRVRTKLKGILSYR
jgi:hypothetical protein